MADTRLLSNGVIVNLKTGNWRTDAGVEGTPCAHLVGLQSPLPCNDLPIVYAIDAGGQILAFLFDHLTMAVLVTRAWTVEPVGVAVKLLAASGMYVFAACKNGELVRVCRTLMTAMCFARTDETSVERAVGSMATGKELNTLVLYGKNGATAFPNIMLHAAWDTDFSPLNYVPPPPSDCPGLMIASVLRNGARWKARLLLLVNDCPIIHTGSATHAEGAMRTNAPVVFSEGSSVCMPSRGKLHRLAAAGNPVVQMVQPAGHFPWLLTARGSLIFVTDTGPRRTEAGLVEGIHESGLILCRQHRAGQLALLSV